MQLSVGCRKSPQKRQRIPRDTITYYVRRNEEKVKKNPAITKR